MLAPWKESYDKPKQHIKKQRHHFPNKGQSYFFSSSHVWMWELDHKEGWALKNWCFWIVVLEKTLESSLDYKEIQAVNSKGNQPWIFIGRTDAEVEALILWPPNLPPEKSVCGSRSNSKNQTWNNRLVQNWKKNTIRLYIVTLLI